MSEDNNGDVTDPTGQNPAPSRAATNRLRLLDFDDLFLLGHLLEGNTIAATAKQLGLTQPAITQRVRKIERVFGETILKKAGRHVRLTKEGRAICDKAADALSLMRDVTLEPARQEATLGVASEAAFHLLWRVIGDLYREDPERLFHLVPGTHEELMAMLDTGAVDGCVTEGAFAGDSLTSVSLGEEDYLLVANAQVAGSVEKPEDLGSHTLLELDKSYSLYRRLDSAVRAGLRFRGVWFLGRMDLVMAALKHGFGVGVVPHSLAAAAVSAGQLVAVLPPEFPTTSAELKLISRKDPQIRSLFELLEARFRVERSL